MKAKRVDNRKGRTRYISPEQNKAYKASFDLKHPGRRLDHHRRSTYKMEPEEFDRRMRDQNNRCAICETVLTVPQVDHDPKCCDRKVSKRTCGKCTRGLLCKSCNTALGKFRDDPDILIRAALYVSIRRTT